MSRTIRPAIALIAALALAGCGIFFPSARERAERDSPSFKSGFVDGCASANAQSTNYRDELVRDEAAYRTDRIYRAGWHNGFVNCRTNSTYDPSKPGAGPIPDNNPGGRTY